MGDFYYPTRNEDGVYEWMLKDKFGNDIYCYYNGYTELHIKSETKCLDIDCGGELYHLRGARWVCGKCGREYDEKELIRVSDEEFGFYQYPNANHAAAIDFEAYFGFLEGMFDQK